jgi:hypothetical protein
MCEEEVVAPLKGKRKSASLSGRAELRRKQSANCACSPDVRLLTPTEPLRERDGDEQPRPRPVELEERMSRLVRRGRGNWLAALPLALLTGLACGGSSNPGFTNGGSGGGSGSSGGGTGSSSGGFGGSGGNSGSSGGTMTFGDAGGGSGGMLDPDASCETASASATRAPAYLLFVLDGSGSMGMEHKWDAVVPALQAIFTSSVNDPGLAVGLIVFSDSLDQTLNGTRMYPEGMDVPIGYVDANQTAALMARLGGTPKSNTPTFYAMQGGYAELEAYAPMAPVQDGGQKVLVLITDGVPTDRTCDTGSAGTNYPTNPCVMMAATEHMAAAPKGPILTFVVGVGAFPMTSGQDFDPLFLGNVAQAGGGAPMGCDPNNNSDLSKLCYFEVDPTQASSTMQLQQQFSDALQAIRGQVLSCTFPLQSTGLQGQVDPGKVNVFVNGQEIGQSSTNGWSYDNPSMPTSVIFNGPACDMLKSDPSAMVKIVLGCKTMIAQ